MIIFSVHDRDIDRQFRQVHGRVDTGKAAAQYDHPVAPSTVPNCRCFCHRPGSSLQSAAGSTPASANAKGQVQLIPFALPCSLFDALIFFGFRRQKVVRSA
jgi:hypothetical protein